MEDSQKKGRGSSGGQRIDDQSFWGGKVLSNDSVLPIGNKRKEYSSAEGAGSELDYEDTTEKIKEMQDISVKKIKAHPLKPTYRN